MLAGRGGGKHPLTMLFLLSACHHLSLPRQGLRKLVNSTVLALSFMSFTMRVQTFLMSSLILVLPHEPRLAPKGASGFCVLTNYCSCNRRIELPAIAAEGMRCVDPVPACPALVSEYVQNVEQDLKLLSMRQPTKHTT